MWGEPENQISFIQAIVTGGALRHFNLMQQIPLKPLTEAL